MSQAIGDGKKPYHDLQRLLLTDLTWYYVMEWQQGNLTSKSTHSSPLEKYVYPFGYTAHQNHPTKPPMHPREGH